jgi:HK97 family phage portal protein
MRIPKFLRFFERKSLAAPDAALLEIFGLQQTTAAGICVSPESSLQCTAVDASVRITSEAVATLSAGDALPDTFNPWTTRFEGLRQLVADALLFDVGGLLWCNRVEGRIVEFIRYTPGTITVDLTQTTGEPTYRIGDRTLDPKDVVHVRNAFNRSPVTKAREAIALALVMEQHGAKLFSNGARPSGVLSLKGNVSPDTVAKIREAWNLAHGGGKQGGTAVVGSEAKYEALTFNSVDSQFLELCQFTTAEISRAFGVPLPMLSDLSRATWSNGEQQGKEFLSYSLEARLRAVESAFARVGIVVAFDRDDLTRADLSARAEAYSKLIAARVLNPNEARGWEGLQPYTGGAEFANPNVTTSKAPADA